MSRRIPSEGRKNAGWVHSRLNPKAHTVLEQINQEPSKSDMSAPVSVLPCLVYSDNSNTNTHENPTRDSKREFEVKENIEHFITRYGITKVVVITLTFPDDPSTEKERIRWNSLATGVIRRRYKHAIVIRERHENGRRHYHLFVTLKTDVRTGCDFRAIKARDYRTAPTALTSEWEYWRETAPKYGFKRTHVGPIETDARTVAHYFSKGFRVPRNERDRGARLVSYIGWPKVASSKFGWADGKGRIYRDSCRAYAQMLVAGGVIDAPTEEATVNLMRNKFGSSWSNEMHRAITKFQVAEGKLRFIAPMTYQELRAEAAAARKRRNSS